MYKDGSKWLPDGRGFFVSLVIHNLHDGLRMVEQRVGNTWTQLEQLEHLGQQWVLKEPVEYRGFTERRFPIRVTSLSGERYAISLEWKCGDSPCATYTDATVA